MLQLFIRSMLNSIVFRDIDSTSWNGTIQFKGEVFDGYTNSFNFFPKTSNLVFQDKNSEPTHLLTRETIIKLTKTPRSLCLSPHLSVCVCVSVSTCVLMPLWGPQFCFNQQNDVIFFKVKIFWLVLPKRAGISSWAAIFTVLPGMQSFHLEMMQRAEAVCYFRSRWFIIVPLSSIFCLCCRVCVMFIWWF